jgi:hypothetical protein
VNVLSLLVDFISLCISDSLADTKPYGCGERDGVAGCDRKVVGSIADGVALCPLSHLSLSIQ